MIKALSILVLSENGVVAADAMRADFEAKLAELCASASTDFDSVAAEINAFLLSNPGLKTIASAALVRGIWETRVENGELKGKTQAEKGALFSKLEETVPEYVKAHPNQFHMGKKTGIAVRFAQGETVKDKEGNPLYDANGDEVAAFRFTDEEWSKMTAPKAAPAAPPSSPASK